MQNQPANAASVKGQLQTLEDIIKMLREEEGEVTKDVQKLRAEKDTLENDLNHLCIEGRDFLQSEVAASDEEMQRHISSQKAENSRLQLQITQLKADKASLTDQIIRLTQRIQDIESAIGADPHAGFGDNSPHEKHPVTFCELVCGTLKDTTLCILIGAACVSLVLGMIENPAEGWLEGVVILCTVAIIVVVTVRPIKAIYNTSPFLLARSMIEKGSGVPIGADDPHSSPRQDERHLQESSEKNPLQGKLKQITGWIRNVGLLISVITFVALIIYLIIDTKNRGAWDNSSWHGLIDSIIIFLAIIVMTVPEGLQLAMLLPLAYSLRRMKDENSLVRHVEACETMGSVTDVCADKTGTLTQNRMTVTELYGNDQNYENIRFHDARDSEFLRLLINSFCLNNDASLGEEEKGSKTDCALLDLAKVWGINYEDVRRQYPQLSRVPFSSKLKWMATLSSVGGEGLVMVKGASEKVIGMCNFKFVNGKVEALGEKEKQQLVENVVTPYAKKTLRAIALAYKVGTFEADRFFENSEPNEAYITSDLVFLSVVGIKDIIRPEVPSAVKRMQRAGVKVRLITGDTVDTAISIAKDCGILAKGFEHRHEECVAMEGSQFEQMVGGLVDDQKGTGKVVRDMLQFRRIVSELAVLARASPEHKYILVTGLRQMNSVVAVIGDGSNDVPALVRSDVGFAMGFAGTQLAKDAADVILLDDNFASILAALECGRNIYDSIQKFIQFQLTVNVTALTMTLLGAVAIRHSPLAAVQILWVNLIMDTFAALALATEPISKELMKRKPYWKNESIISSEMKRNILSAWLYQVSWLVVILFLGPQLFGVENGWGSTNWTEENGKHFTLFFNTFVFLQVFNEINCRKLKSSEWNVFKNFFNNSLFLLIIVLTIVVQVLIVQFGGEPVNCSPLSVQEHFYCVLIGAGCLGFSLLVKVLTTTLCTGLKVEESQGYSQHAENPAERSSA